MANNTRRGPPFIAVSRKPHGHERIVQVHDNSIRWLVWLWARGPECNAYFCGPLPVHHECVGVSENVDTHKCLF